MPDSRLSEWRTTRGTRGLVTTLEESTGSVGDSSAPTRKLSVQPSPVSQCVATRDDHARQRHRDDELAQRQPPGLLQHLGLDLEPVAEQDHDQRDEREVVHEARARVDVEHAEAAVAEQEPGEHEDRGQRQERAVGDARRERTDHQQPAEDERRDVEARGGEHGHADRVAQRRV